MGRSRPACGALWWLVVSTAVGACSIGSPHPAVVHLAVPATITEPAAPVRFAPPIALPPSPLSRDQEILHVLNRLGYGPRPGDVERVQRIGLANYIRRQLDPGGIDDAATAQALRALPTLDMTSPALVAGYPRPSREARKKVQNWEMTPDEMTTAFPPERRPFRLVAELQAAKIIRAVFSERQLEEVMADFWFNHFNVYPHKGSLVWMLTSYEREAIRPRALGRFRDLLLATARHPAMLYYLDNWLSTRPDLVAADRPNKGEKLGLNENYARELMELHTLGVDGGYTQEDVIEVARCFTGWSIDGPQQGGGFVFRPRAHDDGAKRVLGHVIPAGGGERDGLIVIDLLARHPSTARFISEKLVRRFVSDDPPPSLVERAAATFRDTDGDIRAVLAAIFTSPEFFSAEAYRAKVKTPLEVVASALRAVGARVEPVDTKAGAFPDGGAFGLARRVDRLGEPLYGAQAPTGYRDAATTWINGGALLNRLNFALDLAQDRLPGVQVDLRSMLAGTDLSRPQDVLDRLVSVVLHGEISPATERALASELDGAHVTRRTADGRRLADADVEKLAALILGSPEFQRR
jgi:uncharacterized protein (DUF1800 family)